MAADQNWTPHELLSFLPAGSQQVAMAGGDNGIHLVWVRAKALYHAQRANGTWQTPAKIAGGEEPAIAVSPDGTLYCVYANWFLGNRDIYLSTWANGQWSLSEVVSRTTGDSSDPAICVAPDGRVHLAWADTSPGYSTVYHAVRDASGWTHAPVPNGKGSRPSITANADGVFLAWQDRPASSAAGAYEVLAASNRGNEWSVPVLISDTREVHSLLPHIAANATNQCHLIWQEARDELYVIRHSDLWPNVWETPVDVSDPASDARLGRVLVNQLGLVQFVWSEGGVLKHRVRGGEPQGSWWEPEMACDDCAGLDELAVGIQSTGELHVIFGRWTNGRDPQFFYLNRKALEPKKVLMPFFGA